ncbi:ATP-dependent exonuclease SbcCD, C subunit-like protein [Paeniglutamicibacter antarcticus]|uniref:ATP-dependent exonuclease SbcCD, C subunit-like protein n=1 Tax=Arthrobacter terrae TaxID=2935737 RepID=A0A931G9D1_9MICC|nr:ATP-binding protein [Arthrobacter terrae]MBG0738582.1 ATP-dependent exonuclease SbcCD, C subunit-like protein [Arthrobacter terrae]
MTTELQDSLFTLEEPENLPDDGGIQPGFRLHRLELLNWGTFHEGVRVFRLEGDNSLLTGDIGSGKSTVVDAITTLLLPANRIEYNKAAGAQKKERSLMSYVRGFHKSTRGTGGEHSKPVALRGTGALSVVLGVFHNAVLGKSVTLAITLWATQEAGQPNRFYSLAETNQSIVADFSHFGKDPARLKKKLRAQGVSVHDSFDPYAAAFKRQFGISGNQAMDLFHRTVSMKQVENITSFVRTNMLQDDDAGSRIRTLIHHFDDLKKAHDAVLRAKHQITLLTPIQDGAATHARLSAEDELARAQRDQLHPWFTDRRLALSREHQGELERTGHRLEADSNKLTTDITALRHELSAIQEDIRSNGGGRLEAISAEVARLAGESRTQRQRFETYASAAAELGLQAPENRVVFDANRARLEAVEADLGGQTAKLHGSRTALTVTRAELAGRAAELTADLTSLQARTNLLPRAQLELRHRLSEGTGITESALPYAGELLRVRDGESLWEGAAERTLRGFALSLLVPDEHYAAVSNWVDGNNLRGRLVYLRIQDTYSPKAAAPGTLAAKIAIKAGTPFRDFLLDELSGRFDHFCAASMEDFRRHPKALTANGQLKGGRGRHEKDDRKDLADRKNFVLGWDNHDKVSRFHAELDDVTGQLAGTDAQLATVDASLGKLGRANQQLGSLRSVADFDEIGWQLTARRIEELKEEKRQLESASDILAQLTAKEADTLLRLGRLEEQTGKIQQRLGANEKDGKDIAEAIEECRTVLASSPLTEDGGVLAAVARLAAAELTGKPLTYRNTATVESTVRTGLTETIDALTKRIARAAESTVRQMADFRNKYPNETTEIDASLESAGDFNRLLAELVSNDLPRFEAHFKESLNQNTIHEVVAFNAFLDSRRQDIVNRIGEINVSLAGIEYNPGRHIQLEHQNTTDLDVRQFGIDLRACSEGTIGDDDQYSEQKYLQVERLIERFRGRDGFTTLDERWTAKVTDVRNWFTFSASEKWTETGEEYEHFTDSGGKSGGQKEKLAYTILAAALAFQFGLGAGKRSGAGRPSAGRAGAGRAVDNGRSFRFVVIDEAFGRGSDESARYGLELFQRMKLQLLIVTPLQKIHVIEPFVSHVGFVANPNGNDSQLRNMTIQEYRAERDKRADRDVHAAQDIHAG